MYWIRDNDTMSEYTIPESSLVSASRLLISFKNPLLANTMGRLDVTEVEDILSEHNYEVLNLEAVETDNDRFNRLCDEMNKGEGLTDEEHKEFLELYEGIIQNDSND